MSIREESASAPNSRSGSLSVPVQAESVKATPKTSMIPEQVSPALSSDKLTDIDPDEDFETTLQKAVGFLMSAPVSRKGSFEPDSAAKPTLDPASLLKPPRSPKNTRLPPSPRSSIPRTRGSAIGESLLGSGSVV